MSNELILITSLVILYSLVVVMYKLFGKTGLYCWTVLATIAANIEVSMVVDAFGLEQTLGNVLFATTFLVTDILSERHGKKAAQTAVNLGIVTSLVFALISQSWSLYTPSDSDSMYHIVTAAFKNTPRIMLSSVIVYAVVQRLDVFFYHAIWDKTTKLFGSREKFLWLRNNAATLLSQLLNSFLFNLAAFWGVYPASTIVNIALSGFVVYIFTSLLDTPAVYIARKVNINKM